LSPLKQALRPDQLAAALACGCAFSPATEDQVRRLAAQRRIFFLRGEPVVAVRGGFLETWATLAALIENHGPIAPEPSAEAGAAAAPEHDTQSDAGPSPGPARPDAAKAKRGHRGDAAATRRGPRVPRSKSTPADTGAAHTGRTVVGPSDAEETLAGSTAAPGRRPKAFVPCRGRRRGWPPTPRWMVAGRMRRGRLK
jgi:hypothetical protein